MIKRIAFCGYAGVGKDAAAEILIQLGWKRRAFGDIIKRQVDGIVQQHLGFSAFTPDRTQKEKIRRTLEAWGEDNYAAISDEFFRDLPEFCVNTRLVRVPEALRWKELGGQLWLVKRPGVRPATQWESDQLSELFGQVGFDQVIDNNWNLHLLWKQVAMRAGVSQISADAVRERLREQAARQESLDILRKQ